VAELYRPYGATIVLDRCYDLAVHNDQVTGPSRPDRVISRTAGVLHVWGIAALSGWARQDDLRHPPAGQW